MIPPPGPTRQVVRRPTYEVVRGQVVPVELRLFHPATSTEPGDLRKLADSRTARLCRGTGRLVLSIPPRVRRALQGYDLSSTMSWT
jgi:hypothetical protein